MGIGKRIKERRDALGLTQEQLAKIIGVTKGSIANYENQVSHPKEPILYKLFDALQCDANNLFQDEMGEIGTTKKAPDIIAESKYQSIIDLLDKLTFEQVCRAKGYIERMVEENEAANAAKQIIDNAG